MTKEEFKRIRVDVLGLTAMQFARELGLEGKAADRTVRRYESGDHRIIGPVARCAELLLEREAYRKARKI